MKELGKEIKKAGFTYIQEFADTSGFIYSQWFKGELISFEAFLRKENKKFNCVSFPSDKAFGVWAWSCVTFERAKSKLHAK